MKRRPDNQRVTGAFDIVRTVGLALPEVEATTKYDGSPVLKVEGIFMAGLATHRSAEPDTLVIRAGLEDHLTNQCRPIAPGLSAARKLADRHDHCCKIANCPHN
jgi:hypothetical protein